MAWSGSACLYQPHQFPSSLQLSLPSLRSHSRAKTNLFALVSSHLILIYNLWLTACKEIDQPGLTLTRRLVLHTLSIAIQTQACPSPDSTPNLVFQYLACWNVIPAPPTCPAQYAAQVHRNRPLIEREPRVASVLSCCATACKSVVTGRWRRMRIGT